MVRHAPGTVRPALAKFPFRLSMWCRPAPTSTYIRTPCSRALPLRGSTIPGRTSWARPPASVIIIPQNTS